MSVINFVKIPVDFDEAIKRVSCEFEHFLSGDQIPNAIRIQDNLSLHTTVEVVPLKRMSPWNGSYQSSKQLDSLAGVYLYVTSRVDDQYHSSTNANIRATCLSMACGLHSKRLHGDIYVGRLGYYPKVEDESQYQLRNSFITENEISCACYCPDLRSIMLRAVCKEKYVECLPEWILDAARCNYEDASALGMLVSAMKKPNDTNYLQNTEWNGNSANEKHNNQEDQDQVCDNNDEITVSSVNKKEFIARSPLCLHCRATCSDLCDACGGAYFHNHCKDPGWSHRSICKTWKCYTERRDILSDFPFYWHFPLVGRECQLSDRPYEDYLRLELKVLKSSEESVNWWNTEQSGWNFGRSRSAKRIDIRRRLTYMEGFELDPSLIPSECRVTNKHCEIAGILRDPIHNIPIVKSWKEYYALRHIPLESPVALLLTFPLTIYHAFTEYGEVPITVSRMLKRPMRVHVVGVEKELNFLDLFKELGFLLPQDLKVELVFIVREDMVPTCCDYSDGIKLDLAENLSMMVQSGTYNQSIDPNFDCGNGPPDMLIAMNAGLYAYDSWRDVIGYLDSNRGVVGVFTDYNEYSGVNCASLGGIGSRESLTINPFRQPRAMPVYSMNLPQFSNGFIYVFNEQKLE